MKKKRVLSLLLVAAMAIGMVSGCGNSSEGKSETAAQKEDAQAGAETKTDVSADTAEAADDGDYYVDEDGNKYKKFDDVQLKFLVCWNGGFKTATDQYNNDVAKAIREKIGVTVEFEGIMMNEAEKLNMMFASGDIPDMISAPYWGGTGGETGIIKKAGQEGRLLDLKDLVPQYPNLANAYDIGVISKKYLENDIDIPENNGARYVLPTEVAATEADITNWAYGVFVRQDVADTLGVDPTSIKTSEELFDFMVKARDYGFKDVNGNDCIVATTFHNGWNYGDYSQSFGEKKLTGYHKDENGNVVYDKLSENWVDSNLFIWKMVHEGLLDKECFTQTDERANEKVGNGTALFTCAQYRNTIQATQLSGLYNSNPEMRYVPVGPLNYKDGSPLKQTEQEGRTGSPVIIFSADCANPEAALTWLDYVNSKEGNKLIYYGFEGDTYELNENGQPRMNADLTARYAENSEAVKDELRERGIMYIGTRAWVVSNRTPWFGESEPFVADSENEYIKAYKEARPVEILPGYAIDAAAQGFEKWDDFYTWAEDGAKEQEYRERAYFADTEEEARQILEDYQEWLRTNENGMMDEFIQYMTEASKTRDDYAY